MDLGTFSLSLNVKDIKISFEFYKKLGFTVFGGDIKQNWLILKNKETVIGLFQDMFEKNIMTFNPGWDKDAKEIDNFTDVRCLQREIKKQGITIEEEIDDLSMGPGSIIIKDPDGNTILLDQHR